MAPKRVAHSLRSFTRYAYGHINKQILDIRRQLFMLVDEGFKHMLGEQLQPDSLGCFMILGVRKGPS